MNNKRQWIIFLLAQFYMYLFHYSCVVCELDDPFTNIAEAAHEFILHHDGIT